MRKVIKTALATLFGFVDTDTSFYLLPPTDMSRVEVIVFDNLLQARAFIGKLLDTSVCGFQWSDQVVCVPTGMNATIDPILERGTKAGKIKIVQRTIYDPRGQSLDNWTDAELRSYIETTNLAKSGKGIPRAKMIIMISDDFYGSTGGGVSTENAEDATGKRLVKIFDKLAKAEYARGKTTAGRAIFATLEDHRETLFETGRKRRITDMKKLVPLLTLKEKDAEGILAALTEMGRA